jgi:outer membrane protein assembly factor BamD (BamD/ComL family)
MAFPREDLVAETEKIHTEIEELFAENLIEVGKFYQKTKKKGAAEIYYNRVIAKYPKTKAALNAQERLDKLNPAV